MPRLLEDDVEPCRTSFGEDGGDIEAGKSKDFVFVKIGGDDGGDENEDVGVGFSKSSTGFTRKSTTR